MFTIYAYMPWQTIRESQQHKRYSHNDGGVGRIAGIARITFVWWLVESA
jgi:hypothetical protein